MEIETIDGVHRFLVDDDKYLKTRYIRSAACRLGDVADRFFAWARLSSRILILPSVTRRV